MVGSEMIGTTSERNEARFGCKNNEFCGGHSLCWCLAWGRTSLKSSTQLSVFWILLRLRHRRISTFFFIPDVDYRSSPKLTMNEVHKEPFWQSFVEISLVVSAYYRGHTDRQTDAHTHTDTQTDNPAFSDPNDPNTFSQWKWLNVMSSAIIVWAWRYARYGYK